MHGLILVFALLLGLIPSSGWAAPTVESAQNEVDRLRTLAAEKFEAANEATIRIKQLEKQTAVLESRETVLRKELDSAGLTLSRIAISQYTSAGLGQGLDLLFSSDPSKYLSDAGVLEMVSRKYAQQLRQYQLKKQNVEATQLVVEDKTALLKAERAKLAQSYKGDNTRGSIALKYALAQVGDVYVWAAAGPTRWDCSGLTMRAFQKAGVSLPHSSRIQVKYGKNIPISSLKPGDLLFFGKPISHVSMYMGGGKMVQAPRPGKRVEVVKFVTMFGKKPFVGARRL